MNELIEKFKKLKLEDYPEDVIKNLITEIGKVPIMRSEYHEGKIIYRARPHEDEDYDFPKISDLSYKPEEYNNSYQRASTPSKTMFYGALIPEDTRGDLDENIINDERAIGAFEVVKFLRDLKIKEGEKVISYGIWRVNSTISTLSVIQSDISKLKVNWLKTLATNFYEQLKNHPEFKEKTPIIQDFLAREFSKHVAEGEDYKYMISGLFSHKACELGVDGVLYPSVKMKGRGLNIALTPECVDSKLSLVAAIKCKVYKKCGKVILNNLKKGTVDEEAGIIHWEELPIGKYRMTEAEIRSQLSNIQCPEKRKKKRKSKKEKRLRLMKKRERKNLKRRRKTNR